MAHNQKHSIIGSDHLPGIAPPSGSGKVNLIGTNDETRLEQVPVESINQATPAAGDIVRRQQNGQILLPSTSASGNQAISVAQAQTLLVGGMYRGAVDNVVPDHTSDDLTGLTVGYTVIETGAPESTEALYRVTDTGNGTTGSTATWNNLGVPDADVIYVNLVTGGQWMYSVDRATWINMGASSHNRTHDITSPADHTVPHNVYGILFATEGGVNILSMVEPDTGYPSPGVPKGAPVLATGNGEPMYGGLLIAEAVYVGSTVEPTEVDVRNWAANTVGVVKTTAGRYWVYKESSALIYAVEMGQA